VITAPVRLSYKSLFEAWYRPRRTAQAVLAFLERDRRMTQSQFRGEFNQVRDEFLGRLAPTDLLDEVAVSR
jgi:hypothetical protein